jgi:ferredoxin-thioredoxin reductase catalytic chain
MAETSSTEDTEEEILAWARNYAEEHGWELNPEEKQLRIVIKGLARNRQKFGERYCPCRLRSGDTGKDRSLICPCIYHYDEVMKEGHCHCRLFFKKQETEAGSA